MRAKHPPTLGGIAAMMGESDDACTLETGALLDYVNAQHTAPVTCYECMQVEGPCTLLDLANAVGIAWLMRQVPD